MRKLIFEIFEEMAASVNHISGMITKERKYLQKAVIMNMNMLLLLSLPTIVYGKKYMILLLMTYCLIFRVTKTFNYSLFPTKNL